eukprot:6632680-Ditylum_brightwellii.AAC.1
MFSDEITQEVDRSAICNSTFEQVILDCDPVPVAFLWGWVVPTLYWMSGPSLLKIDGEIIPRHQEREH